jgi:DnaK suppressor protein
MGLSENKMQHFSDLLQQLKIELLEASETGEQAEEVVELDQARVGRLSRMDAMQAQAMSVETGRRRRQLLVEIDAALERVKEGYYGDCLECDESIHPGRLEANPSATLCISCAEAQE